MLAQHALVGKAVFARGFDEEELGRLSGFEAINGAARDEKIVTGFVLDRAEIRLEEARALMNEINLVHVRVAEVVGHRASLREEVDAAVLVEEIRLAAGQEIAFGEGARRERAGLERAFDPCPGGRGLGAVEVGVTAEEPVAGIFLFVCPIRYAYVGLL